MSFNWYNYYLIADQLYQDIAPQPYDEESKKRVAISRAYYAAYRTARNYLEIYENIYIGKDDSSHIEVIRKFEQLNFKSRFNSYIAENLRHMMTRRLRADYENTFTGTIKRQGQRSVYIGATKKEAGYTLGLALQVFKDLDELRKLTDPENNLDAEYKSRFEII